MNEKKPMFKLLQAIIACQNHPEKYDHVYVDSNYTKCELCNFVFL